MISLIILTKCIISFFKWMIYGINQDFINHSDQKLQETKLLDGLAGAISFYLFFLKKRQRFR